LAAARVALPTEPIVDLQPLDGTREPWVRSVEAKTHATIQFVNATSHVRKIYWLDYNGQRRQYAVLPPGKSYSQATFLTHPWVVTDTAGLCLAIYLAALQTGRAMLPDAVVEPAGMRSTTDQPDDAPGYQVHAMYVLPSDGVDQKLDIDGAISDSLAAAQNWFVGQTGGQRVRFDTYHGALDVSFLRLPRTDAELSASGEGMNEQIGYGLLAAGFNQPNKIYPIYYGGSNPLKCGDSSIPGTTPMLYLHGTPAGANPCASNSLAAPGESPGYLDYSMIHEIVHSLGFVPPCAPHSSSSHPGHVDDDPRDLMYAGPLAWQPSILDVGHDDYFEHHNAGCADLAKSAFLDPAAPDAVPPALRTFVELQPLDCTREPSLQSLEATTSTTIQFVNATSSVRKVYWLDYRGQRRLPITLPPWSGSGANTFLTHPFVVTDPNDRCLGIYLPAAQPGRAIIRD
jgi:hypothetical protein